MLFICSLSPSLQPSNESKLIETESETLLLNSNSCTEENICSKNTNSKWYCKQCTYLNYSPAKYCVQCSTKRVIDSNVITADLSEDMLSLNFRGTPDSETHSTTTELSNSTTISKLSNCNYSKTNSPLASSSNLAASIESSKKTEMKWRCSVSIHFLFTAKNGG